MTSLIKLTTQLDQNPQSMVDSGELIGELRKATWIERLKIQFNPQFRAKQQTAIAQLLTRELQEAPRETPKAAYEGRPAYIIKRWIGRSPLIEKFTFKLLKEKLTAYRLGITSDNLNASIGLQEFSEKKAFLYNYLAFYHHTLKPVDAKSPVRIMRDGEYVDWNDEKTQELVKSQDVVGLWPYKYGKNGLQNEDFTNWIDPETRAFSQEEHPCPGKYLFSYCTYTATKNSRIEGDHSWFRLTTPEGKVYEFGKYRPPHAFNIWKALMKLPATIQSPDSSSLWPVAPNPKDDNGEPPLKHTDGIIRTQIHFEITKEQFLEALDKIISIQKGGQLSFGIGDGSCVMLSHEIADICGIQIDTRASIYKVLLPLPMIRLIDNTKKYIPATIRKVLYFIPGILVNLASSVFFGACAGGKGNRYIGSVSEFFDPEKSLVHYPWYLATRIKEDVEASRPAGNPFGIPDQFKKH